MGSLVKITPYHRLHEGLLTSLTTALNSFHVRMFKVIAKSPLCFAHILAVWAAIVTHTLNEEVDRLLRSVPPAIKLTNFCTRPALPPNTCWLVEVRR